MTEAAAAEMAAAFPDASEKLRREALHECGLALDAMVEGVRQDDFESLERTLVALAGEYERGDARRRKSVRGAVITAKNHARFVAASQRVAEQKRAQKREMEVWIRTWLENPALFEMWVKLRKKQLAGQSIGISRT